jgi:endonuclease/exonuclease/phosphatase family metal-dependent hydrolase
MIRRLFVRQAVVQGQEVKEPTHLAIGVTALGFVALLAALASVIFLLYPHGHYWAVGGLLAVLLAWLARRRPAPAVGPSTRCQIWSRRVRGVGRKLLAGVAACWLALTVCVSVSPGGPMPPSKENPAAIRVVTWNVLCGQEDGPFWRRSNWAVRKQALGTAVREIQPDILCVQEARPGQVAFLEKVLLNHHRVGVGRDDGAGAGEHCAIFFDRERFEEIGGGTFWLEQPTDQAIEAPPFSPRRICTWVRLRDRESGRTVRVYNTHLYLTEGARQSAARIILERMAAGDPTDAVILTGDFNAPPNSTRRLFAGAELVTSAAATGQPTDTATWHFYGIPLRCLDAVFVNASWRVNNHRILATNPAHTFPSDHFGVLADLTFRE